MTRREAQGLIADVLMDKIEGDKYPSATHMDLVEQLLPPEKVQDYLAVLMDKAAQDTYPSVPMLRRMLRVTESLPVSERSEGDGD